MRNTKIDISLVFFLLYAVYVDHEEVTYRYGLWPVKTSSPATPLPWNTVDFGLLMQRLMGMEEGLHNNV